LDFKSWELCGQIPVKAVSRVLFCYDKLERRIFGTENDSEGQKLAAFSIFN